MADRLASLKRIARVQADMVKLAEWRVAAADRQIAALNDDRARLADYASSAGALGEPLARAALRSMVALDRRGAEVRRGQADEQGRLGTLRRRDRAVAAMTAAAATEARRVAAATELVSVIEAWLSRHGSFVSR